MANWSKIKREYVTGSMSYKNLAKKHGVSFSQIMKVAAAEKWVDQRKTYRRKAEEKTLAKSIEKISDRQSDDIARIDAIADKLLEKLEKAADELDLKVTQVTHRDGDKENYTETKTLVAEPGGMVDQKAMKALASALKDLREIKGLQTELQHREQEARIALLEKQGKEESQEDKNIIVTLEGVDDLAT